MTLLPEFTKTPHCRREAHCGTCRDLEGGRAWREQTAELFNVMEVDWPCPRGHEWGYEPPERKSITTAATMNRVEPHVFTKRLQTCRACTRWDGQKCSIWTKCASGFRRYLAKPFAICLGDALTPKTGDPHAPTKF